MSKWLYVYDDLLSGGGMREDNINIQGEGSGEDRQRCGSVQCGILKNTALAVEVYLRIKGKIPREYGAARCNEVFRFSGYEAGGDFKMHRDGTNQDSRGRQSVITVEYNFERGLQGRINGILFAR